MKKIKKTPLHKKSIHEKIFFGLIILILLLSSLNMAKAKGWLLPEPGKIIIKEGNIIDLQSLTLEQKIAQMTIVAGETINMDAWKKLQLGGIHMFAKESPAVYKDDLQAFQKDMVIPFFVTIDLEGCINPLANFYNSPSANSIDNIGQAFQKGSEDGRMLKNLGFSINFAPVVDLGDQIWKCRAYNGDEKTISEFAEAYILGLQSQGIIATIKHYPGKALVTKDPHKELVKVIIEEKDLYPYQYLIKKKEVQGLMVTHVIASGLVDSEGKPADASENIINPLQQEFTGLLISDEINMLGLKNFYKDNDKMYIDIFKGGSDLILNFNQDPNEIYHMILVIKQAVEDDEIDENNIDNSVRKILTAKGFTVEG